MGKLVKINEVVSMTSREIADFVGKLHKNVIRDIRDMEESWVNVTGLRFELSEYKDKTGRKLPQYKLNKNESLFVVSKYDDETRAKLILKWDELEKQAAQEKERLESRSRAAMQAPELTEAIKLSLEEQGKDSRPYYYSNNFDMINRIVLGMTSKQYRAHHGIDASVPIRDTLSLNEIKAIEHLQNTNKSLLEVGYEFDERKERLTNLFKKKFESQLVEEILRLEA